MRGRFLPQGLLLVSVEEVGEVVEVGGVVVEEAVKGAVGEKVGGETGTGPDGEVVVAAAAEEEEEEEEAGLANGLITALV